MNRRRLLVSGLRASVGLACFPVTRFETAALLQKDTQSKAPNPSLVKLNSPPQLVAHWKLDGDCQDELGHHHGEAYGLTFAEGIDGRAGGAAVFNGIDSSIEVPDADALNFRTEPFSIAFWVKVKEDVESAPGDLMNKFDASLRRGFNLSLAGSSSGYSSFGDSKGIHFGIDNGINGSWLDCGRPWKTNPMITTPTVFKGQLYAATSDAARAEDACRIFRFGRKMGRLWTGWECVGRNPHGATQIHKLQVFAGRLYAGTWPKGKCCASTGELSGRTSASSVSRRRSSKSTR